MNGENPIVKCSLYRDGVKISDIGVNDIRAELSHRDHFVWIGLHDPDHDMLLKLQKEFGLHDLAIEDALHAHQRPKLEAYGNTLFIVLRTAQMREHQIEMGETHFFVGSNFLITLRHGSSKNYADVRSRCESNPKLLKQGAGFALYAVMDAIVDQYFPIIDALEDELNQLEDKIFNEELRRETTESVYRLKRQLMVAKQAVSPLIDICNRLMRFDLQMIDQETRPYFRDIYDHAIRINEMIDNQREIISTAMETNFSLISISQSEVSKRFAGWAALIGVPTLVVGIYGMNFRFMPELQWKYAYPIIMTITFVFCGFLYYRLKRAGWL